MIDLLLGLMVRSTSEIASGAVNSMSSVSWVCCGYLFSLVSTPVIPAYPIIRPLQPVKVKCSGTPFVI